VPIRKFESTDFAAFKNLFDEYFKQEFNVVPTKSELDDICNYIVEQVKEGIQFLDVLIVNNAVVGFNNYQIDSPKSNWCQKEGWGCIREIYIQPSVRKNIME
jgi:hypothetical protein